MNRSIAVNHTCCPIHVYPHWDATALLWRRITLYRLTVVSLKVILIFNMTYHMMPVQARSYKLQMSLVLFDCTLYVPIFLLAINTNHSFN
jgi:hypothetical protein